MTSGAATLTGLETGVVAIGTAAVNYSYATAAYESGAFVGSIINAIPVGPCGRTIREHVTNVLEALLL